jgi:hypothetical protein
MEGYYNVKWSSNLNLNEKLIIQKELNWTGTDYNGRLL